jgi:hypothetical protein
MESAIVGTDENCNCGSIEKPSGLASSRDSRPLVYCVWRSVLSSLIWWSQWRVLGVAHASWLYILENSVPISWSPRPLRSKDLRIWRCSGSIEVAFLCFLQFTSQACPYFFLVEIPNYRTCVNFAWLLVGLIWILSEKRKAIMMDSFRAPYILPSESHYIGAQSSEIWYLIMSRNPLCLDSIKQNWRCTLATSEVRTANSKNAHLGTHYIPTKPSGPRRPKRQKHSPSLRELQERLPATIRFRYANRRRSLWYNTFEWRDSLLIGAQVFQIQNNLRSTGNPRFNHLILLSLVIGLRFPRDSLC